MMTTLGKDEIREIAKAAVGHAADWDYMLDENTVGTAVAEEAARMGLALSPQDQATAERAALDLWDEPHDDPGPEAPDRHSVGCVRCATLADERECLPGLRGDGSLCPACLATSTRIRTEDGTEFSRQADGSWSDGTRHVENFDELGTTFEILA